jgi:hypothetical protein
VYDFAPRGSSGAIASCPLGAYRKRTKVVIDDAGGTMSRMLNLKNVKLAVLVLLASLVVLVATRSLLGLSQYPVRQAAELR